MNETTPTDVKIRNGLLKLLGELPYSKIRINMIANEIGMTRQNIYKHYASKDQILMSISEDVLEKLEDLIHQSSFQGDAESWKMFQNISNEVVRANAKELHSCFNNDTDEITYKFITSFVTRLLGHIARVNEIAINDRNYFQLIVENLAGSIFNVIKTWAQSDMAVPQDKVALLVFDRMDESVIEKLRLCESS